jgi:hypothetical protein
LQKEEVKQAVKQEVQRQLNTKKSELLKSRLQRVARKIVKFFMLLIVGVSSLNPASFRFAPNETTFTYDNAEITNLTSFDQVLLNQEELNKLDDFETITNYYEGKDEQYLIADKKKW